MWSDIGFCECFEKRREYQLINSAKYLFLSNIDRMANPDYLPSQQEILHIYIPTKRLIEHKFYMNDYNDKFRIKILDLGGQKNERRKWIHNFDNLEGIIFMAALSDYDMFTFDNKNRLMESLKLFKIVMEWFRYNLILEINNNNFWLQAL